jgi:hypothetical protein
MAPPLTVTRAEIDTAVEILDASIQDALDAGAAGRGGARGVIPAPRGASGPFVGQPGPGSPGRAGGQAVDNGPAGPDADGLQQRVPTGRGRHHPAD